MKRKLFLSFVFLVFTFLPFGFKFIVSAATEAPGGEFEVNCAGSTNMQAYNSCTDFTEGKSCPKVQSTAKGGSYSHECTVVNKIEMLDNNMFKQHSNDIHFLYQFSGTNVNFLQDTIWGGMFCDDGNKAMYRVYSGDTWGAAQFSTNMNCGVIFPKPEQRIEAYDKTQMIADGNDIEGEYGLRASIAPTCTVTGQSDVPSGGSSKLIFEGQAKCCDQDYRIASILNVSGPGAGEVYMYCQTLDGQGRGLCAHYESLNFEDEDNQPKNWDDKTDLCKLKAAGDKEEYYLQPIGGVNNQNPDQFYADLVIQGYQSYCYVPEEQLKGVIEGFEPDKFSSYPTNMTVESSQEYDYSEAQVPLWRKFKNTTTATIENIFDSLEAYWGSRNTEIEDQLQKDIASAPVYSLMTREEQCLNKIKLLVAVEAMCNKLENPSTCALDKDILGTNQTVTGYRAPIEGGVGQEESKYTYSELLNAIRQNTNFTCERFGLNDYYDSYGNLTDPQGKELADTLDNVPFYLDSSYRMGFLVIAAEIFDEDNTDGKLAFNFLPKSILSTGAGNEMHHDVRILAFKLPDIGTNRNPGDSAYYKDALEHTADSLISKDFIDAYQAEVEKEKAMAKVPGSTDLISPLNTPYYTSSGFVKKLVEFVNNRTNTTAFYGPMSLKPDNAKSLCGFGSSPSKDQVPYDPPAEGRDSYTIADQAKIYEDHPSDLDSDKFKYTQDGGGNIVENLEEEGVNQKIPADIPVGDELTTTGDDLNQEALDIAPKSNAFEFISRFYLPADKRGEQDNDPKILTYLIVPQGYNLNLAEDALNSFFDTQFIAEHVQEFDEAPPFLKLQNTGLQFFATSDEAVGTLKVAKQGCVNPNPAGKNNPCLEEEITATVQMDGQGQEYKSEPRILGGRLGFITRKIQESITELNTDLNDWISGLKSTEEFLIGYGSDPEKAAQHKNPICAFDGGYPIASASLRSLIADAANKYDVPIELMSIIIAGENCKHASSEVNICLQTEDYLVNDGYLDEGKTFQSLNGSYFNNCADSNNTSAFRGMFRMNILAYPDSWLKVAQDGTNICSVHDQIYALANAMSAYNVSPSADQAQIDAAMKKALPRYVLGPATHDGTGEYVTCESAMEVADKYSGDGNREICDIRIAGTYKNDDGQTTNCVKKEWLWAVGAYCCAADKATGQTPGAYCTTDPWVQKIERVTSRSCE